MPCRCYAASAPHHASHATAPQVGPATAKRLASRGLETVDELLRAATADFPKSDAKKAVRPRTLHAARAHTARTLHAPAAAHAHRAPLMRPSRTLDSPGARLLQEAPHGRREPREPRQALRRVRACRARRARREPLGAW